MAWHDESSGLQNRDPSHQELAFGLCAWVYFSRTQLLQFPDGIEGMSWPVPVTPHQSVGGTH